jgi:hypothetical protein
MSGYDVHIVGSVPLPDAAAVFATLGGALGDRIHRVPDGETGERLDWVSWLAPLFAANPALEPTGDDHLVHAEATPLPRFRLKPGAKARDVNFGALGYADHAARSYAAFTEARSDGTLPAPCRFQVALAPAHTIMTIFFDEADQAALEPVYDAELKREIARIAQAIPNDDLAIQFDVASAVFFRLESGAPTRYGDTKADMQAAFAREMIALGDCVPASAELLYHLCYGDNNHRHSIQPTDMSDMVELANRISAGISRPIQLFHMPVPRDRSDDAYFAPLGEFAPRPETKLALGLVHHTDGVAGTRDRLAKAEKYATDFLIATECGFGRRSPDTIMELLRIHAKLAGAA